VHAVLLRAAIECQIRRFARVEIAMQVLASEIQTG
jgi:hypothetical protein